MFKIRVHTGYVQNDCQNSKCLSKFDFWQRRRFFDKSFDFDKRFDFWQKFRFLTKLSIFDKCVDFWQIRRFLTKFSIFDNASYMNFIQGIPSNRKSV